MKQLVLVTFCGFIQGYKYNVHWRAMKDNTDFHLESQVAEAKLSASMNLQIGTNQMATSQSMGVFAKMEELLDNENKFKELDKSMGHHVSELELNQMKLEEEVRKQEEKERQDEEE